MSDLQRRRIRRPAVLVAHRLDMLAIEHQLAFALEDFVGGADQAEFGIFRLLVQIGADRIDGVADEGGLDEAQLVVTIGKGIDAIRGDEPETGGKDEGAGNEPLAEQAFGFGEDLVADIGVHVEHQRVELLGFAFRDRATQRADLVVDFEVLVEPVLRVPDGNLGMIGRHGFRMGAGYADSGGHGIVFR